MVRRFVLGFSLLNILLSVIYGKGQSTKKLEIDKVSNILSIISEKN